MFKKLTYVMQYLLGRDVAGRTAAVFPDDTFIVSYPRSGNTWTRFLVANLLHPDQPVTFGNIERLVPDIHAQSKRFLRGIARPRVLKSHEYFDPRYPKVIYIVRDPRDVVVSSYHFHRKQRQVEEGYPLGSYVRDFIAGSVFQTYASWGQNAASWIGTVRNGAGPADPQPGGPAGFGSWADNVESWTAERAGGPAFLLLRYEDMLEQPQRELAKVAGLLNIKATPERLDAAVERSSPEQMRLLERSESKSWVLTKGTRQDIPFVRAAGSGGWKSALPEESVGEIERAWGPLMKHFAYELTGGLARGLERAALL